MINRNLKDFKFQHKRKQNQVLFISKKTNRDKDILNLINNFLVEKNSFVFESVEKELLKEDILYLEKTLIKFGSLIKIRPIN